VLAPVRDGGKTVVIGKRSLKVKADLFHGSLSALGGRKSLFAMSATAFLLEEEEEEEEEAEEEEEEEEGITE